MIDLQKVENNYQKVSYNRQPNFLTIDEWQYALRKKFAEKHYFKIDNQGSNQVYSDFNVYNPETKNTYKVAIRSADNSMNFCSCNDFKTNELGTCKHIEAVLYSIRKENKQHLLSMDYKPAYTSVFLSYAGSRKIKLRIGYENEEQYTHFASKYFNDDLSLKQESYEIIEELIAEGKRIHPEFRCYNDALEFILDERERIVRSKIVSEKYASQLKNGIFDSLINTKLYPYQKKGVCFAAQAGRCMIADDMGLGKTIQSIAVCELLKKEMNINSVLIICPTSLKYQWKSEIEKFTQSSVFVIEGIATKRMRQYEQDELYKIVSYHTAINDIEYINSFGFDMVILDEAQRIKNYKTKISATIKKIKFSYSIVLTGTPLENKLEELYSIVQFIDPYKLGPFHRYLHFHQIRDDVGKVVGYKDLNKIGEILSPIMIRRHKKDVLVELPERIDKNLFVPMTDEQSNMHSEFYSIVSKLVYRWRKQGFLSEKDRQRLMINLNMMRMVCDSTYILDQESRFDTKIDELMNILVEALSSGTEKIVVFSQWERMTRLVAKELDKLGEKYEYLHGGVPSAKRKSLIENFNRDRQCRIFLSTDAGGVGLNLQAASLLINLDIPWNPAVLEQRIARIHRIGQKKNVSIINMVSINSIEHRMLGVIDFKKSMAEGVLDQGENTIFLGEDRFKKFMESVEGLVGDMKEEKADAQKVTKEELDDERQGEDHIHENDIIEKPDNELHPVQKTLFGDDDIPDPTHKSIDKKEMEKDEAGELINLGMSFIGKLAKTLSDADATKELVSSLMQKDETDGKTYMKIPVESKEVVENTVKLFAGLLSSINQR